MIAYHASRIKGISGLDRVVFLIRKYYALLVPLPMAWALGNVLSALPLWHLSERLSWGIAFVWTGLLSITIFAQEIYGDYRYHLQELARTNEEAWEGREKEWERRLNILQRQLRAVSNVQRHKPGFVYIMRREDGVYKIGYTDDVIQRNRMHEADYGMGFEVVKAWLVPNKGKFEKVALNLTTEFEFNEENRRELRQMTRGDVKNFMTAFNGIVQREVS